MRHYFEHAGRRLGYLDATSTSGPRAGTLVLLHAFPLSAEMWQPQLDAPPPGWRVLAPDLRGFGQSSPGAPSVPVSVDDDARDVVALLDHLSLDRVVVGGLSMGGYVAFAALRVAPDRLRGIVLADTRAEADDEEARLSRDRMAQTLAQGGAAAVLERMLPGLLGDTTRASRPEVVRRVREMVLAQPAVAIGRAIHTLKTRPDSTPLLQGVTCPALVVVGDEDQITDVASVRRMHGLIPGAQLAVVDRAGHLSNLEQPHDFNAALSRFLAERFRPSAHD
jgi:3-oxoadipate enol-lactonase